MIRTIGLLQLLVLTTIRDATAEWNVPSLTGRPMPLDESRSRLIKGKLGLQSQDKSSSSLPVNGKKRRGLKGKGPSKGGDYIPHDWMDDNVFPDLDDIPFLDDTMFDDGFWQDGNCKLVAFNETFYFLSAAYSVDMGGDPNNVGSQFLFSQNIFAPDTTPISDTLLTGVCTRTSSTGIIGTSGGGTCQFNLISAPGNYSITVQGYLDTVESLTSAGNLVITGGSGSMVSVVGEMNIIPCDENGHFTMGDIFTGVYAYYVQAALGVIVCPAVHDASSMTTTPEGYQGPPM